MALITKLTTIDMGGARTYNASGGFSGYDYHQVGETIYIDDLKGKVIAKKDANGNDDYHAGLPAFSNTSDFYAHIGSKSGEIVQVKFYEKRIQSVDFDWGHIHTEGDGKNKVSFPEGVVHVQTYVDGKRTGITRYMNNEEIKKYGSMLKKLNPNVKFRP